MTNSQYIEMDMPEALNAKTRQDILASATSVNIHQLVPYFYGLAIKMSHL